MTTNKKINDADSSVTMESPELENIFHWTEEHDCYKNQFMDSENKFQYERWTPVEETRWNNFRAKCIDIQSGKWFTKGENGRCLGKEAPKRYVTAVIRLKSNSGAEYLLSNSRIIGYDASGDPVITTATWPEKYNKTIFRFETVPNYDTGFSERRNTGPCGYELIYTMPFNIENAQKLFDLRDSSKQDIQFMVKSDEGQVIGVIPQKTINETFKLFTENSFEFLYNALYIPTEQKIINSRIAEKEGLIDKMTDDERMASILAQEALNDKQKHIAIQ